MQSTAEFRKLEKALDDASWARNFGSAVVAGAAAVVLTLLLAGTRVWLEEFWALETLYAVLLSGAIAWSYWSVHAQGRRPPRMAALGATFMGLVLILTGTWLTLATTTVWPLLAYSRPWWWFVAEALPAAWLGGLIRDGCAQVQWECRVGMEEELRRQRVRERRKPPPLPPGVS